MKAKFISILMAFIITAALIPVYPASAAETSGTCGENLIWTLDNNGTLTISGTGEMEDSPAWGAPDKIKAVKIQKGVTSIGMMAFNGCSNLTSIIIPDSVTEIGGAAFMNCQLLNHITIPDGVTQIIDSTFWNCGLTSITIPANVIEIQSRAFYGCSDLISVTFLGGTNIDYWAFKDCASLKRT